MLIALDATARGGTTQCSSTNGEQIKCGIHM
jgi:hypothetical protein